MSKKVAAEAQSASTSAVPHTSIHAADNEIAQRFLAEGVHSAPTSEGPKVDPQAMIDGAAVLSAIPEEAAKLTAALSDGGFDFGVIVGLVWVAAQLSATLKPTPADRRKTPLLTPDQKQQVKTAEKKLSRTLEAIHSVARVTGRLADARDLGLPSKVGRSLRKVSAAYQTFLSKARSHAKLLDDAGVTEETLAARRATMEKLSTILTAKATKKTSKSNTSRSILELSLALECGFAFYRARAISALEEDYEDLIPPALGYVPRAEERRNAAPKAEDEETDDEGDDESGEDETGAGSGDGEGGAGEQEEEKSASAPEDADEQAPVKPGKSK